MKNGQTQLSLSEVHESVDTTITSRPVWKRIFSFFGPAYLVSVGYMDPGNWATDLAGGSKFGYSLVWVLLMSNLMALLLQSLSARLGIVRGRDLAQANRETYPKFINLVLYLLAEVAIAACDLAEVLGMAIGIQLLTGIPLLFAVLITVFDTFLFLLLQRLGIRKMEAFIIGLVGIIGFSFLTEIILAKPNLGQVVKGFVPHLPGNEALYIAIGIIGATVMPHNLYLHSALVQTRKFKKNERAVRRALKLNVIDSAIALNLAFFVNAAILVLAASVFYFRGRTDVAEIKTAYELLSDFLGTKLAPTLFAVALIAAGQSSTITGTLAGQIVMEGYLRLRINPWIRRLMTRLIAIIPAVIVILINGEDNIDSLLILSQVVLSLQLSFAIIPLIHFVSDKKTMGSFAIKPLVKTLAWLITSVLVYLNLRMVVEQATAYFNTSENILWKAAIALGGLLFVALLLISFFYPIMSKKRRDIPEVHAEASGLQKMAVPVFRKIGVALEFSEKDEKLLSYAMGQAHENTSFVLIHVVESASAKVLEKDTDDLETRKDQEHIDFYAKRLKQMGHKANGILGFNHRAKEIVRIIKENEVDMLVIGAHGHAGIKDWFYGQTIDSVRHELKIPVLVVHV
ncbi:MAG TPA: Nramp family divalent metal transporter [Chitinophagaceae bacterium]|jgi:manganese transport protein|nr:Nramp family divalent metal transporter [Chitinophagaceae bacterium]